MNSPRDKYQQDPMYHAVVNMMLAQIEQCNFTPAKMREAATLASIMYAEQNIHALMFVKDTKEVEGCLKKMAKWAKGEK